MNYRFIIGNAAEELMKLPAGSIDVTITSPPYDTMRVYNGFIFPFEDIARGCITGKV